MTIVVTDNCESCRFTECVAVCPVACFHSDDQMVYIDPAACIDCCACIPVCPVQAICQEEDLPPEKRKWVDINKERSTTLPLITAPTDPLPTAKDKRASLGY